MPQPAPLRPGDPVSLGGYTLTGRLGVGGQGVVYLARDRAETSVAVKVLHADLAADENMLAQFLHEVSAAKQVARFCTAQILDADVEGDRPYVVSEYVDGPSLAALVTQDGPRSGAVLERLAIGMATALTAIHQAGIIHRDFKPGNVLIGPDGPRVIDFGISRALDMSMSMSGGRPVGTPAYMAPEQFQGERIGPALDVFSFGGTLVYAASGHPPFGSEALGAIMHRVLTRAPDLGELSDTLRDLAAACLAKDQASRPEAAEILHALLAGGGGLPPGIDREAVLAHGLIAADDGSPASAHAKASTGAAASWDTTDPSGANEAASTTDAGAVTRPRLRRRGVRNGVLAGTAAAVAGTGAFVLGTTLTGGGHHGGGPASPRSSLGQAAAIPRLPAGGSASSGTAPAPGRGTQPVAPSGQAPTTQPVRTSSHPATRRPATTLPAAPTTKAGTLSVSQTSFSLAPDWTTVTDEITAVGGPVTWTATSGLQLRAKPGSGSLGAGQQVSLLIKHKGHKTSGQSTIVVTGERDSVTITVTWG